MAAYLFDDELWRELSEAETRLQTSTRPHDFLRAYHPDTADKLNAARLNVLARAAKLRDGKPLIEWDVADNKTTFHRPLKPATAMEQGRHQPKYSRPCARSPGRMAK